MKKNNQLEKLEILNAMRYTISMRNFPLCDSMEINGSCIRKPADNNKGKEEWINQFEHESSRVWRSFLLRTQNVFQL